MNYLKKSAAHEEIKKGKDIDRKIDYRIEIRNKERKASMQAANK